MTSRPVCAMLYEYVNGEIEVNPLLLGKTPKGFKQETNSYFRANLSLFGWFI